MKFSTVMLVFAAVLCLAGCKYSKAAKGSGASGADIADGSDIANSGSGSIEGIGEGKINITAAINEMKQQLAAGETELAKEKFLLPHDINEVDGDGNTVLHWAAFLDDDALIAYFVTKGANTDLKNKKGETPLHVAINNDSFVAAAALASMGLGENLFARNADGITALDLGLQKNEKYYDIFRC